MLRFNYLIFISFVWIFWLLSGCELQEADTDSPVAQKSHAGYLRIPFQDPVATIDPGLTIENHSIEIVEQLFLGLTDFDPKTYEVVPELATHWEVNQEGTIYTFHLRQDAKWSNGEPVTAHDVVWAIQRNLKYETGAPSFATLMVLKNAEPHSQKKEKQPETLPPLGIRAIDDYRVEFTLEYPIGYFPALASMWTYRPLPRKVIEQYGNKWTEPEHIQTSGSYQLTEWNKGDKLILTKNPYYYDADKVKLPKVEYQIIPDSVLALAMYEKGDLDMLGGQYLPLPQMEIPRITSDIILRKEVQTSANFMTEFFSFNTKNPPMDNPLVRKAIAAAIDKQALNDFIIWGVNSPATTFTRPPIFGAIDPKEEFMGIPYDPKQARAWLAEAGYPEGKKFPKVRLLYSTSEDFHNIALATQEMLKHHLGIEIEIVNQDWPGDYLKAIEQDTTHIFRMAWTADYPDANNWLYDVFHPNKGFFHWIWDNPEFAEAVEKAQQGANPEERKQLYHRAEQILTEEETAIVPVYFATTRFLVKPWVKGWYSMAFGGQHIRHWYLEN
jgi:ABC-type oligopeptide transport system substrate-binding subunit